MIEQEKITIKISDNKSGAESILIIDDSTTIGLLKYKILEELGKVISKKHIIELSNP